MNIKTHLKDWAYIISRGLGILLLVAGGLISCLWIAEGMQYLVP